MKEYLCSLSKTKMCKFGGNKYYNFGFLKGTAGYCRKIKKWISDIKKCPLIN
jgi:hypothetical protein